MADATGTLGASPVSKPSSRQQRAAWAVLTGAFTVFCVLCAASGLGLRYFLLDSTVPLQSILTVGRGTAGFTGTDLIEQVVRYSREVTNNSMVATDRQSQATLSFFDPYSPEELVAAITVRNDTVVDIGSMSRPRFEVSGLGFDIGLQDVTGRMKVVISGWAEPPGARDTGKRGRQLDQPDREW